MVFAWNVDTCNRLAITNVHFERGQKLGTWTKQSSVKANPTRGIQWGILPRFGLCGEYSLPIKGCGGEYSSWQLAVRSFDLSSLWRILFFSGCGEYFRVFASVENTSEFLPLWRLLFLAIGGLCGEYSSSATSGCGEYFRVFASVENTSEFFAPLANNCEFLQLRRILPSQFFPLRRILPSFCHCGEYFGASKLWQILPSFCPCGEYFHHSFSHCGEYFHHSFSHCGKYFRVFARLWRILPSFCPCGEYFHHSFSHCGKYFRSQLRRILPSFSLWRILRSFQAVANTSEFLPLWRIPPSQFFPLRRILPSQFFPLRRILPSFGLCGEYFRASKLWQILPSFCPCGEYMLNVHHSFSHCGEYFHHSFSPLRQILPSQFFPLWRILPSFCPFHYSSWQMAVRVFDLCGEYSFGN